MDVWKRTKPALMGGEPVRRRPWPAWPVHGLEEERRLLRVLREGRWSQRAGGETALFERRFAGARGSRHAFAVATRTAALRLALGSVGWEPGSEVILPAYGPLCWVGAVLSAGMRPVFADVVVETGHLDMAAVEGVATENVRGVLVFHTAGLPVPMEPFLEGAENRGWAVLEDASQAHGGVYRDRPCGTWGRVAVFSFDAGAVLTAGEGGLVLTNDAEVAGRCRRLLGRGEPGSTDSAAAEPFEEMALDEFAGAMLNAQLDRFELQARRRDQRSRYLAERLADLPGVYPQQRVEGCTRHGGAGFLLRLDADRFGAPRDAVVAALAAEGIPCGTGWREPLPERWARLRRELAGGWPVASGGVGARGPKCVQAQRLCRQAIWLEGRVLLADQKDMDDIVRALEKLQEHGRALKDWWRRERSEVRAVREGGD
ncbi:hypothetical protein G4L39_12810 [Limisphaera ngatamarikiensis]|uniref:DegT/DnrJ/EryC1/StrS family aminotransferase n=1 Tax=Limisphaera ngatamarikiensis TaxID=1324935 RepID=A0A6M1RJM6_9BACT|nr:DegT/DnrJ/EryC1/StrS family aminotransferase [Limisphaera ngatamarikiensis]NGO40268.1 hypothetical protein [Limisphaera ngatamarikiensis]